MSFEKQEEFMKLVKEAEFESEIAELKNKMNKKGELDDDKLDGVVGGFHNPLDFKPEIIELLKKRIPYFDKLEKKQQEMLVAQVLSLFNL